MGVVDSLLRVLMNRLRSWCCWLWRAFLALFNMNQLNMLRYQTSYRGDLETHYDSTWEDETDVKESEEDDSGGENAEEGQVDSIRRSYSEVRNERAAKDMQNFRHMLRKADEKTIVQIENKNKMLPNLHFYQNKKPSEPDGVFIKEFHEEWFGDYQRLEYTHSFIQWLFPIQEKGMNWDSYVLSEVEIKLFRKDEEVKKRLVKSYKLMLDFYGIKLLNEETGKVCLIREKWEERFNNLDRNTHNNLRITRILKCLGILGFQHYQAPLVKFFLHQTLVKKRLPRVKQSALDYFLFSVVDKKQRKKLIKYAFQKFQRKEEFVWCPKKIQRRFLKEIRQQITEDSDSDLSEPEPDAEAKKCRNNQKKSDPGQNDQNLKDPSAEESFITAKQSDQESEANTSLNGENENNTKDLPAVSGGMVTSLKDDKMPLDNSSEDSVERPDHQKIDHVDSVTSSQNHGMLSENSPGDSNKRSENQKSDCVDTNTPPQSDNKIAGQSSGEEPVKMPNNHNIAPKDTSKEDMTRKEVDALDGMVLSVHGEEMSSNNSPEDSDKRSENQKSDCVDTNPHHQSDNMIAGRSFEEEPHKVSDNHKIAHEDTSKEDINRKDVDALGQNIPIGNDEAHSPKLSVMQTATDDGSAMGQVLGSTKKDDVNEEPMDLCNEDCDTQTPYQDDAMSE